SATWPAGGIGFALSPSGGPRRVAAPSADPGLLDFPGRVSPRIESSGAHPRLTHPGRHSLRDARHLGILAAHSGGTFTMLTSAFLVIRMVTYPPHTGA